MAAAPAAEMSKVPETKILKLFVLITPAPEIVKLVYCISRVSVVVPDEIVTDPSAPVPKRDAPE
jgi:hypothetical protein